MRTDHLHCHDSRIRFNHSAMMADGQYGATSLMGTRWTTYLWLICHVGAYGLHMLWGFRRKALSNSDSLGRRPSCSTTSRKNRNYPFRGQNSVSREFGKKEEWEGWNPLMYSLGNSWRKSGALSAGPQWKRCTLKGCSFPASTRYVRVETSYQAGRKQLRMCCLNSLFGSFVVHTNAMCGTHPDPTNVELVFALGRAWSAHPARPHSFET